MIKLNDIRHLWAEVNINNLEHNIREVRKSIESNCKIMAVIKANGYGHGAVEVSKVFVRNGIDFLAVAMLSEGIELRKNRIDVPIVVLGYTPINHYERLMEYDIIPTIFDYEEAICLSDMACQKNKKVKIHIKIDTGMGRIGFQVDKNLKNIIYRISRLPNIEVEGIFSHFARADEKDLSYSRIQYDRFNGLIMELEEMGLTIPIKHISNSAGLLNFPEYDLDLVRPGIVLYGLYPSSHVNKNRLNLKPVMTLKSRITYIKELEANSGVSYGHKYITSKKTLVGTIPMGYADGLPKNVAEALKIKVRGKSVDIIGAICMDQLMVDLSNIEDVSVSDEVVIFGYSSNYPYIEDGREVATMNYELLAMLGRRIPRIYMYDGRIVNIKDYIED